MASTKNVVFIGDDWKIDFQYKKNGNASDLTGVQEIRACIQGSTGVIEVTKTALEIVVTNFPAGIGYIKFPKIKTADAKKSVQPLTVVITDADGDVHTVEVASFLDIRARAC